jgi:hypothetical protein
MDIAAWLRGLSLKRYAQVFRDNAIELEALPELSEADLERLSASEVGFGSTAEILRLLERVSFTPASRPTRQLDRSSLQCQLPTFHEPS